ncbi:MAG: hypothetical protein MUE60_13910, partial [Candidatus Eisenbacteria bacterium]|nr:hypothetical protein [Candidatus Eisenbacteria bacterium]
MRSLVLLALLTAAVTPAFAQWPEVTIQDIQTVANADSSDDSAFNADTVRVVGVVVDDARSLWIGARWSTMITTPEGGPWSGLQVVQNDTMVGGTNFSAVQPGFKVRFTGYVEEYPSGDANSGTELILLTNPLVPIEVLGIDALPEPEILTCEDFATRQSGEPWEMVLVTIQNAVMINNDLSSDQALIQDDTGFQLTVEDWYNPLRDSLASGLYSWPPNGSRFDITGHIRDLPNGAGYAIAPRSSGDIHLHALAPLIEDVTRDIVIPGSSDAVNVSATIYDMDGTVASATLAYRVDGGAVTEVPMAPAGGSIFAGTIPAQAHNSVVEFFFEAEDDAQNAVMWPDTSTYLYLYHVLDEGFGIYHAQWTPYGNGVYNSDSPYA